MSPALMCPPFRQRWVLHEDDSLLVVNKPAGMPVHPGHIAGLDLRSRLQRWRKQQNQPGRLWLLHGLDQQASGIVLLSKTKAVNRALAHQFEVGVARTMLVGVAAQTPLHRRRRARARTGQTHTRRRAAGTSNIHLSLTRTEVAHRGPRKLVRLDLGARGSRPRRQLAAAGTPIVGDRDNHGPAAHRLMLHHASLSLKHPLHGRPCHFEAPLPAAMSRWLQARTSPCEEDDAATLQALLEAAASRRYALSLDIHNNCFRVLHGAGDGLPGVEIDHYDDYAVLRVHEQVTAPLQQRLAAALMALGARGVQLKVRPRQANVVVATHSERYAPKAAVLGASPPPVLPVREHGVTYSARLSQGLSTGLFLDQRHGRARVKEFSAGRRVLNLFAYHGAFTVAAVAGGAASSLTIDASQAAVDIARDNLRAYRINAHQHHLLCTDALEWLQQQRAGARFDFIIVDPPSYATTKRTRFAAKRDYPTLARHCLRLLAPAGILLACSNHRGIQPATFLRWIKGACAALRLNVLRLQQLPCPLDHPAPPGASCHLKSVLLQLQ